MFYNNEYDVLTPEGFRSFVGLQKVTKPGKIDIFLKSGKSLTCAMNHRLLTIDGWIYAKHIRDSDILLTDSGQEEIFSIDMAEGDYEFYDLVGVENFKYYTNGIVSHNCEFLGSSNTLIDGKVLQRLTYIQPIHSSNNVDIYQQPIKGRRYLITVDTSRGVEIDYSACIVFDITKIPYNIVAKFKANDISPLIYPNVISQLGYLYNEAFILVETNDIGQQVVDILQQDLEYPAVLVTQTKGRAGQKLSTGFGGKNKPTFGVKTTKQVKRIGCANFKSLVENDKLIVNDFDLLYEMARFIENKASYEAEEGEHDDLVMCCVLFAWLSNQPYFKDLSETDIRNELLDGTGSMIDEDLLPFGWSNQDEDSDLGEFAGSSSEPYYH